MASLARISHPDRFVSVIVHIVAAASGRFSLWPNNNKWD